MVPNSRASLRVDRLRALNLPLHVDVVLDERGLPAAVRQSKESGSNVSPSPLHPTAAGEAGGQPRPPLARPASPPGEWGRKVEEILEIWRVDDEWWRRPITRRYVEVLLQGGGHVVLFEDLVTHEWFLQKP